MEQIYENAKILKMFLMFMFLAAELQGVSMQCSKSQLDTDGGSCISEQTSCQIPENLEDLRLKLHPINNTVLPGSWIEDGEVINVECVKNAGIQNRAQIICDSGKFRGDFPQCLKYCDATTLVGLSTQYECSSHNNRKIPPHLCTKSVLPGTNIKIICRSGFKRDAGKEHQTISCLPTGSFDQERESCIQDCGSSSLSTSIVGGSVVDPISVPWHVAIYENINGKFTYICGGSIVAPSIVVSAAHCFWDVIGNVLKQPNQFKFVAGKYNKEYSYTENEMPQMSSADGIFISNSFRGKQNNYRANIAIVKLESPFVFNENISSICWPKNIGAPTNFIQSNIMGTVARYGPENTLKKFDMITRDYFTCLNTTGGQLLADDKFCLYNNDGGEGVCRGDSGGGFVQLIDDHYNLVGIISDSPSSISDCTRDGVVAVTNVGYMEADLSAILAEEMRKEKLRF